MEMLPANRRNTKPMAMMKISIRTMCFRCSEYAIFKNIYINKKDIVIEIIDNGPGMSETVSRRIFEPFFSTKAEGSGTGLGLSVSYFIITEQMGGVMEVYSEPSKGATFTIRIPMEMDHNRPISDHYENQQIQFDLPLTPRNESD